MPMKSAALAAVFAFVTIGCAPRTTAAPTFCEIASAPEAYAGQTLTIEGDLHMDRHGSVVLEPPCEGGVAVGWQSQDRRLASLNDFARQWDMNPSLLVRVRVTGTMLRNNRGSLAPDVGWKLNLTAGEIVGPTRRQR